MNLRKMLPSHRPFFLILSLLALLFFTILAISSGSSVSTDFTDNAHPIVPKVGHPKVERATWRHLPWMNHGSYRWSRKHLVNPTMPQPFEIQESPV
ncbi:hypothetical protein SAY86_028968 [Trapa natans]|uniref:Uncharacterized protein n=1 Tax=Trapa natans TaxID=22666 RepID=A0AAN7MDP7_TRANT|nr:hypothetical protein SAY86_028968 [Trapa natans]